MTFPQPLISALLWLPLALAIALPAAGDGPGVTSFGFEASILDDLGIGVDAQTTAVPLVSGQLGFAHGTGSDLTFSAPGGDFEGFSGGVLRHTGELLLVLAGQTHPLDDFELRVADDPSNLDLYDAAGNRWLRFANAQPIVAGGDLHLRNIDVELAPELAGLLGRPELAGSFVGQAELVLPAPRSSSPPDAATQGDPCADVFTADRDVSLIDIDTVTQLAREPGGRVALTFPARLKNTGTSAVLWKRSIEPDGPPEDVGEHPFLALAVYRILKGRISQIGRSDVKHAFFASNTNCTCAGGHVIYPTCEDLYGASTNSNRMYFAPREEVSAGTGAWSRVGSHFDGSPVDDYRHHGGNADHDDYEHRLVVAESDLQTGGTYFVEAWYIISGDVDLFNSMGHDEVVPGFAGSTWSFPTASFLTNGSVLDEFVDPISPPAGSANDLLDTGEGRLQLAVAATDLGGGDHHYEYALMNYDFDRQVRTFRVPLDADVTVSDADFDDGDGDAGNDWTSSVDPWGITWTAPASSALDWGTLYSFGFDADRAPVDTTIRLGALEPGPPPSVQLETLGPVAVLEVPSYSGASRLVLLATILGAGALAAGGRRWRRHRQSQRSSPGSSTPSP